MKFVDKRIFKGERFSIGIEATTGRSYLAIPVANSLVEYEEYYEIDQALVEDCANNLEALLEIARLCRTRQFDHHLIMPAGRLRGTAL
ncbi:hypothetical protein [Leeia aquatica]|uniref:Uncharacterized protein n=1 Tax=Leeia aquatica TaxID=2725557 RepID=A0A847SE09_9NEIS|nr:hypothetical protein [Leeia aquatica]NLR75676.1 hypothetical protein [Leeia aquatica]